jgi:hypothetical protein
MEISHARDDYKRRFYEIFGHIPNTSRCMEDIIIFFRTNEEHICLLRLLSRTADEHNVSFNKNKTVLASHTGVFAGYVVSEHGFCPNHALTQAIREFPQSSNVTDLRSFFELCQQVGNFSPMIAAASCHLPRSSKKSSLGIGPQITKPHLSLQEQNWQ